MVLSYLGNGFASELDIIEQEPEASSAVLIPITEESVREGEEVYENTNESNLEKLQIAKSKSGIFAEDDFYLGNFELGTGRMLLALLGLGLDVTGLGIYSWNLFFEDDLSKVLPEQRLALKTAIIGSSLLGGALLCRLYRGRNIDSDIGNNLWNIRTRGKESSGKKV